MTDQLEQTREEIEYRAINLCLNCSLTRKNARSRKFGQKQILWPRNKRVAQNAPCLLLPAQPTGDQPYLMP